MADRTWTRREIQEMARAELNRANLCQDCWHPKHLLECSFVLEDGEWCPCAQGEVDKMLGLAPGGEDETN